MGWFIFGYGLAWWVWIAQFPLQQFSSMASVNDPSVAILQFIGWWILVPAVFLATSSIVLNDLPLRWCKYLSRAVKEGVLARWYLVMAGLITSGLVIPIVRFTDWTLVDPRLTLGMALGLVVVAPLTSVAVIVRKLPKENHPST